MTKALGEFSSRGPFVVLAGEGLQEPRGERAAHGAEQAQVHGRDPDGDQPPARGDGVMSP
ncbi:hypothetical protein ADL12_30880 [Streptomyces regalis]|uniref:Uncharacterized protein n=1 Tax=Streptomyces regalis TaxID=68262 RepID=A0A117MNI6_9ACTN|nr:hypothetical protein ADL12_30880 [Streptomyces regalis]